MTEGNEAGPAGKLKQAESRYRRALELYALAPESEPEEHAEALLALGKTLNLQCRDDEALDAISRAVQVRAQSRNRSPFLAVRLAYARGWVGAFNGDFDMARTETERALNLSGSPPKAKQQAALPEMGAFIADVEEGRGRFEDAVGWLERILTFMSDKYTPPEPPMPFYYPGGIALRLHHAYSIAGASAQAQALADHYTISTARAGASWLPANQWVAADGACAGLEPGNSPYAALDDTPGLAREVSNCFVAKRSDAARYLIKLLFSPDGRVLAAEGAAIDLHREQLECACRAVMQAKLPPIVRGFRSRHLEGDISGLTADYRGM